MDNLTQIKANIEDQLQAYFNNTDFFIVEVQVLATGKITVFADKKTSNISIDECVNISRFLANYLDEIPEIADWYSLDVSSPGMSLPLKVEQQYIKQIGKPVEVVMKDGRKIIGNLTAFENDTLSVVEEPKKKNKTEENIEHQINLNDIKSVIKHFKF
ncbi:MAG: hypothetical protein H6553_10080 [Chitinophagales bacterium]|nr:hypothetical protein [Chitinophagales bacterium]